jgi:hypothetical protein
MTSTSASSSVIGPSHGDGQSHDTCSRVRLILPPARFPTAPSGELFYRSSFPELLSRRYHDMCMFDVDTHTLSHIQFVRRLACSKYRRRIPPQRTGTIVQRTIRLCQVSTFVSFVRFASRRLVILAKCIDSLGMNRWGYGI